MVRGRMLARVTVATAIAMAAGAMVAVLSCSSFESGDDPEASVDGAVGADVADGSTPLLDTGLADSADASLVPPTVLAKGRTGLTSIVAFGADLFFSETGNAGLVASLPVDGTGNTITELYTEAGSPSAVAVT